MQEECLLSGDLEPTNEPYAIAKIAGIKMCESYNRQYKTDFRSVMPTNLYGINDNYHSTHSHVVPALIRRFHESKISNKDEIKIWGTGQARREFLYVDDMAEACIFLMNLQKDKYDNYVSDMLSHINIGSGSDISIKELAKKIQRIIGFKGKLIFDNTKEDGAPQKLLDISKIKALGWSAKIDLDTGIKIAYDDFIQNNIRK
jgi:GDP-L-fucose synthase